MAGFTITNKPVIETDRESSVNYLIFDKIAMTERKNGGADIELFCKGTLVATCFVEYYTSGQTLNFDITEGKMRIDFTM